MTANLALFSSLLAMGTVLQAQTPATPAPAPASGPQIKFEEPVYDFGKVKSGELVKHTYVFTNTGTEMLILTNVQPSCGCTTAGEWTRQVEPGKTGTIPIQFNSANYGGQVMKTITVTSNDKGQPSIGLQLKGTIWKPIDVQPQFAVLTIPADAQSNVTTSVHIVNNMEEPITLSPPESSNKGFITELKTNTVGKDFSVMISAVPPFDAPNVQGQITLKTSSTNMPVISLTAWANVMQAVTVSPPQVMLASGPLANKQTVNVAIQNNSANPITLSEPTVEPGGVEIQISEPNPGRSFTAALTFPAGFDLAQGAKSEFTVKTSHPKHALIKVPIMQLPKPVATPGVAPIIPLQRPPVPVQPAPAAPATSAKTTAQ